MNRKISLSGASNSSLYLNSNTSLKFEVPLSVVSDSDSLKKSSFEVLEDSGSLKRKYEEELDSFEEKVKKNNLDMSVCGN